MRVSVYTIYVLACLLAIGGSTLSGFVLLDNFHSQQKATEDVQLNTGLGQVSAVQIMIGTQMARLQTTTDSNSRLVLMKLNTLSDDEISPQKSVQSLNNTIWSTWVPYEKAPNSVAGVSVVLLYTNETTGRMFDRTFWAYRDVDRSGESVYAYAFSNISDNLVNCYVTQWTNYSTPQLGNLLYKINVTAMMLPVYTKNNFFVYPFPWTTADGNSYWTFFHMRAFHVRDMWVDVGAWDVSANWLGMLQSALTPGAEFVAFDSRGYVTAATTAAELQRRSQCRAAIVNGQTAADCILSSARSYPIAEIRDMYTALHQPIWDDVTAGTIEPTAVQVHINGQRYLTITATLFSEDLLRVIVVWYQPWAVVQGSSLGLTSLICSLALLSTFVLTVLGVFGVLRPLMAVGRAMRAVARTLKQGEDEAEAVVEPRNPSVFREVDEIGKDFETIVVDFLGFSSTNARNNKCAPRDSCKPFAVVFTDVQSSTGLWGKDPVEMSRCMQVHHELIRGLIKEHGLYEVKTIGDSFMVTTTSAQEALHFALDIQTTFYEYEWDWEEADEYYQETTLAFTKSGSAESEYNKLWNGLRIRIGAEAEGLEAMLEYALDGLHICCETYDLTLPWPNDANPHKVPVPNDFAFNQHLRQPFSDVPELERLCPVVLQGLAEQRPLGDERDAFLSYLVRKSVVNPGPRLHARGLNHNSGPANEYECELLLWYRAGQEYRWASYVWRRGSVPLHWQSVASGLSEELLLSDDIAHQAEWYFYGLMQRYSYLLRAPQPFVAPPTSVGDERKDSSCSTQTPSTPSAAFGNERSPPASPLPKAHSPDATSVLTRRFSTAPARDLMSRLQSTVENLLNPSTPLSGGSRSSSRFPTKRPCLPVSCISLLRLSGNPSEERLNAAFRDAAPGIAQRVEEVAEALDGLGEPGYGGVRLDVRQLDWHEETKCRGALGAADALLGITNTKDVGFSVGSFQVSGNDTLLTASIHQLQGGLLRPNCRDSLDRTNLACFWLTINVLPAMSRAIQLDALILRPPPSSGDLPSPTAKMSRLPSFRPTLSSPKASPGPSPSPSPRSGCPSPQALPSPRGALPSPRGALPSPRGALPSPRTGSGSPLRALLDRAATEAACPSPARALLESLDRSVVAKLAELFLVCGDVCAMLYTCSAAMHTDVLRALADVPENDSPATLRKKSSNAQIAFRRLIQNRLKDNERQMALEMILDGAVRSPR